MNKKYQTQIEKANILVEALPYINAYSQKTVVIKYGGNAMNDASITRTILQDVATLKIVGVNPILVHGGGPEINYMLGKLGIQSQFKNGLRVTDNQTMEIVQMALCGKLNKNLAASLNTMGVKAVGLCGKDGSLIETKPAGNDLGYVGEITNVNPELLIKLVSEGYIPVVASVGSDKTGESYNINADTAAGAIAAALNASKLMFLTDVDGIKDKENSLISKISADAVRGMIANGEISGGMVPKAQSCLYAIDKGLKSVLIINGTLPHAILLELFTDSGIGTMITA